MSQTGMDRPEMADANVPRINKAFSWAVAYWKREKKPILRGLSMDVVGVMAVLMVTASSCSSTCFKEMALMRESAALVVPAAQKPDV